LKILQIISGRGVNGAVTYCKFLCDWMLDAGHEVAVLCRRGSWLQQELDERVNIVHSEMHRTFSEVRRLRTWVRDHGIELIHTHMNRAHAFGALLSWTARIPVIASAHNQSFELHWRWNDFVLANSDATRQYHRKVNLVSESKIRTVYCVTDLARFTQVSPDDMAHARKRIGLQGDEFVVGVVGHVCDRKGQLHLFQALPHIAKQIPNIKVVLLGPFAPASSYVKRLHDLQTRYQLDDRVAWIGVSRRIPDFMSTFDLCVVPSVSEPLGLVAMEALAAGVPVVASRIGGLPEIVVPNVNGLLVPGRDSNALAQAVIALANDRGQRRQLGAAGQRMVLEKFDPDRLARHVEEIYREVLARRQPREIKLAR
jgi:glycosyltransferase involved in cell wall biosynthesis